MRPFYISSTGAGLSATIAGFSVAGVVEFLVILLGAFGFSVEQSFLTELATDLTQATALGVALFGILRKIYFSAKHTLENLRNP